MGHCDLSVDTHWAAGWMKWGVRAVWGECMGGSTILGSFLSQCRMTLGVHGLSEKYLKSKRNICSGKRWMNMKISNLMMLSIRVLDGLRLR
ncbi:MAG: hypothetical protein M2R46_00140 [Verrucomicrobia subdivision 3 bacterium]|nr:hypothetical protein [Limisphaerales bacterium]